MEHHANGQDLEPPLHSVFEDHRREPEPKQVPAFGYSIVANLGGDRQMTVQCFVGSDESDAEVNHKLDRALRFVDRQKAKYELVGLREDLATREKALGRFEEDFLKAEKEFDRAQAAREVELETLVKAETETRDDGYKDWSSRGKRGAYEPKGHTLQRLNSISAAKKKIEEEMLKATNERQQHIDSLNVSLVRHGEEVELCKKQISFREALLEA